MVVAVAVRVFFGVQSYFVAGVLLIGWPLFGTLITLDDDLPGGWSNPDGMAVPEWKTLWWWSDILLLRGSLVALLYAIEEAVDGRIAIKALVSAVVMAAVGVPIFMKSLRKVWAHAA